MINDPISDLLTRIRNALMVHREEVKLIRSRMAERILDILKQHGFVENYAAENQSLVVKLKYDKMGAPVIEGLKRVSRPGLRVYSGKTKLPRVHGGLGVSIVSTSRGVMTGTDAKKQGVGGEVLCAVW